MTSWRPDHGMRHGWNGMGSMITSLRPRSTDIKEGSALPEAQYHRTTRAFSTKGKSRLKGRVLPFSSSLAALSAPVLPVLL